MYYAIDRFEGDYAVLEDDNGNTTPVRRTALPAGARQGDVLEWKQGQYTAAPEETRRRREAARRLEDRLRGG